MAMYDLEKPEILTTSDKIRRIRSNSVRIFFSILQTAVLVLASCVVLYLLLITPHQVDGNSMYPNFHNTDYVIANKMLYRFSEPKRGDVIIFKYSETKDFIKRIIGLPGDVVTIKDGQYYINGKHLDESDYLAPTVVTAGGKFLYEGIQVKVPEGEYFVSGDNRPKSSDSRSFGTIKKEQIKGRVFVIISPLDRFMLIKHPVYE
ncbi:signal peptidase I [Candidatus Nomurabacteria bacterium]|nr:signal peptidase I [Candidatus Nomurabacteria bacterium]